jgi:hypothetical protein
MNLNLPPLPQLVIYFFFKNDHALPLLPPSITRERDKKTYPTFLSARPPSSPKLRKERERTWLPFPSIPY